mgnify:CR=1 FL=1
MFLIVNFDNNHSISSMKTPMTGQGERLSGAILNDKIK